MNGRYKHHIPLLHDNEQIWKLARATKEDKHARYYYFYISKGTNQKNFLNNQDTITW